MDYTQIYSDLITEFPNLKTYQNHSLAPYTTLKIGGPADIFVEIKSEDEFIKILNFLSLKIKNLKLKIDDIVILGNGSNLLISDSGIKGFVIKYSGSGINYLNAQPEPSQTTLKIDQTLTTQRTENEPEKYLDFAKLDYDESHLPHSQLEVLAGTPLPLLINQSLNLGLTGLQWFAYIPGSVGGAIWYNIHGGSYHLSQYLDSIKIFNLNTSTIEHRRSDELSWDYDSSHFQKHPELIILSAVFNLFQGDVPKATQVKNAWIAQKSKVQPMNSAGSVFKNPPLEPCLQLWGEQKSTGWIIDHELGLKGLTIGGAQIGPQHANIFTNQGGATAADFLGLISRVQSEAKQKFNLDLETEVKLLGRF